MQFHADLLQRAVVDSTSLPWMASPSAGVERRLLERDGGEVARATSVVRYQPGARFAAHDHDGGEEIFVLQGELCDELGRYTAGTWIKNPVGSRHAPCTETGCLLLVKLRHLDPADQVRQVIDTRQGEWGPGRAAGVDGLTLDRFGDTLTGLVRFSPGARSTFHSHPGGEELFVLEGSFADEHGHYPTGTWVRSPHGSSHLPYSEEGCLLFSKTGHLPRA